MDPAPCTVLEPDKLSYEWQLPQTEKPVVSHKKNMNNQV